MMPSARAVVCERSGYGGTLTAACCLLALLALLVLPSGADASYPRLCNIYFGSLANTDLEALARWELLVLAKRAEDLHEAELATLRSLNPDATIVAHTAVGYNRGYTDPPINADLVAALTENNWWMLNTDGERVVFGPGNMLVNLTLDCPTNAQGQRLCDWLPEYIAERLFESGNWDGVFLDYAVDRVAWLDRYLPYPIDHDLDGNAALADSLNLSWRLGMRTFASKLRQIVGEDFLLIANGNNTLYEFCDGDTRENFPEMHGDWYANMMNEEHGYLAFEALYRQPTVNIINTIWEGELDGNGDPIRSDDFNRDLLFGLTSTLIFGSGYYSCDALSHTQIWWFEYYDVDLGEPLGRAEDMEANPGEEAWWVGLTELIKKRRFEGGLAVINPSLWIHEVYLDGAYYDVHSWNGQFYEYSGLTTQMTLGWLSGEVFVGRGVVPQHTIGNAAVATSREAISLTWDAVDGAHSYSVYRDAADGQGGFGERVLLGVASEANYTDRELVGSNHYRYFIAPIDDLKCEGRRSSAIEVTTEPGGDLSVPADNEHAEVPALEEDVKETPESEDVKPGTSLGVPAPQPARESVTLSFSIEDDGRWSGSARATLTVYDVTGRVVRRLIDERVSPGPHSAEWDLRDATGRGVASGCYLCVLDVGGERYTAKTLVLRQ